jgi:hypothetical protein
MKRSIQTLGVFLATMMMFALANPSAEAGRIGGPLSTVVGTPSGTSVFFDVSFVAGERAVINVAGNGSSQVYLLVYDSDGHVFEGVGLLDRRTVIMNVYRTGAFRVEVRNLGLLPNIVTLTTN